METEEYYGGLYPSPPEEIEEKDEYIFDEDGYNDDQRLKERKN